MVFEVTKFLVGEQGLVFAGGSVIDATIICAPEGINSMGINRSLIHKADGGWEFTVRKWTTLSAPGNLRPRNAIETKK